MNKIIFPTSALIYSKQNFWFLLQICFPTALTHPHFPLPLFFPSSSPWNAINQQVQCVLSWESNLLATIAHEFYCYHLVPDTFTSQLGNHNSLLVGIIISNLVLLESFLNSAARSILFISNSVFFALKTQSLYVTYKVLHDLCVTYKIPLEVRPPHLFSAVFHSVPAKFAFWLFFEHATFIPTIRSLQWLFCLQTVYFRSFHGWLFIAEVSAQTSPPAMDWMFVSHPPPPPLPSCCKFICWNLNTQGGWYYEVGF